MVKKRKEFMKSRDNKSLRYAEWLIFRLCRDEDRYSLIDDLKIVYAEIAAEHGRIYAYFWYVFHVFRAIPELIYFIILWRCVMVNSYLKIAFRNMIKDRIITIIYIGGLSIGMVCCILIAIFNNYELSYDKFHENAKNIYRIRLDQPDGSYMGRTLYNNTPPPLKQFILDNFSGVNRITRIWIPFIKEQVAGSDGKVFSEGKFIYADKEFLKMFTFSMICGNIETALVEPNSVLITEKTADKYFGEKNPIGKILTVESKSDFKVIGVLKNIPDNSHFRFDFLASISSLGLMKGQNWQEDWYDNDYKTYVELQDNYAPDKFSEDIFNMVTPQTPFTGAAKNSRFIVQHLEDIHLGGNSNNEIETNSNISIIYIFTVIGFLIMLIACINYMNLVSASTLDRLKEIGLRKVLGAVKSDLIRQFIIESLIVSTLSLIISSFIVSLLLPR